MYIVMLVFIVWVWLLFFRETLSALIDEQSYLQVYKYDCINGLLESNLL